MVDEGLWVNKIMVVTGYAWWFERYAPDDLDLKEAQEAARVARRGLWAEVDACCSLGLAEGREVAVGRLVIHPSY